MALYSQWTASAHFHLPNDRSQRTKYREERSKNIQWIYHLLKFVFHGSRRRSSRLTDQSEPNHVGHQRLISDK